MLKKLLEIDNTRVVDMSKQLNESMLATLFKAIGLALLGHKTYTVIRGNKPQIEALKDYLNNAKMKEELKDELLKLWRQLRSKHKDAKSAANEFEELTGIKLEI